MSEVGKDAGDVGSDDLEGEALLEERLKEFEEEKEEEPEEEDLDATQEKKSTIQPTADSEAVTKSTDSKTEIQACEKIEGKRWSDGGYGYGFDCSKRKWDSVTGEDSGISTLPLPAQEGGKKPQIDDNNGLQKTRQSFDYNFMTTGHLCPAADDVVAVHNRTQIKFVFLRTGRSRLYAPPVDVAKNRGIGVLAGRDDLSVIAWSDIGPPAPNIHVYQYSNPSDIKTLVGDAVLEYTSIAFNHEKYLIALSGVPEHQFTLWDWTKEIKLHVISTELRGPCNLNFSPNLGTGPARLLLAEPLQGQSHRGEGVHALAVWRIKKCGENTRLVPDTKLPTELKKCEHMSATWAFPNYLFVLTRHGEMLKYDSEKKEVKEIEKDEGLQEALKRPLSPNTFLKAHYDGLLLVTPSVMVIFKMQGLLPCSGTVSQTVKVLKIDQVCCNLFEFHNSYRFISWTPEGNIFNIQTTEMDIQVNQIFNNYSKKKYISGVFIQPEELHFATLDSNNVLQIFYMMGKIEVWSYQFPVQCSLLLCHPKQPLLFVGTTDGRMIMIAVNIKYVAAKPTGSEDDEDEDEDDYTEVVGAAGDTHLKGVMEREESVLPEMYKGPRQGTYKVTAKIFAEKGVHQHILDFGETDVNGMYLVTGAKDKHKIYLCDTQNVDTANKRFGSSSSTKKQKFTPTLDTIAPVKFSTSKEKKSDVFRPIESTEPQMTEDDPTYFKVKSCANLEGILLDLSFVQKTVICLTTTANPLDESEESKQFELKKTAGDQITIFKVDKQAGSISIANVLTTKEICSGICLSENGKFFSTILHKRKKLAKFKVLEHERQSKLTPVSKTPTQHQMDMFKIIRSRDRKGVLALAGRDGYLSFQPEDETSSAESGMNGPSSTQITYMFHHETGGIQELSISKSTGGILAVSQSGAIQVMQTKTSLSKTSSRSTFHDIPDTFMTGFNRMPVYCPLPHPQKMSWAEMQEEDRTSRERQKYESQINEVTNALDELRTQVASLLEENEKLPESERIDRHEFELDVEEQQKRKNEGLDKEEDLMLELRAWQLARKKVGRKIKKDVWDDMEVKGRCIKGMKEKLTVSNYPLKPTTVEEDEQLEKVKEERRLDLEISNLSQDATHGPHPTASSGTPSTSPSHVESKTKQTSTSSKDPKNLSQDVRLLGSRSYEFVDIDQCLLYPQLEVTTRSQARQQITLLQDVVRKLKHHFNLMFDQLYQFKVNSSNNNDNDNNNNL